MQVSERESELVICDAFLSFSQRYGFSGIYKLFYLLLSS